MPRIDPITHGLIGASLALLSGHSFSITDPVILGCTLGAMLPDLDIVTHLKGRLNYLLKHRGASHSLLALGGMALGLSTALYAIYPLTSFSTIFFWTFVGTLSHGIFDLLNSFGAELLWPFKRKKITIDMIMLTDPIIFISFLITVIVSIKIPSLGIESTLSALLISSLYLIYKELGKIKTKKLIRRFFNLNDSVEIKLFPAMYRPFNWNFLIINNNQVQFGIVRKNIPEIRHVLPRWDVNNPYVATALEGSLAEVFNKFTPYYHIISRQNHDECKVEFLDLRYWSKESFIYTGQVIMNEDGQISEELFYPFSNEGILLGY